MVNSIGTNKHIFEKKMTSYLYLVPYKESIPDIANVKGKTLKIMQMIIQELLGKCVEQVRHR